MSDDDSNASPSAAPLSSLPVGRTQSGERLGLAAYDGRELLLTSVRAFAPGQPISLQIDVGIGVSLDLKSVGSVKQPDGSFRVRTRHTTLSRHAREALVRLFGLPEA
jgi:hypothetical protein